MAAYQQLFHFIVLVGVLLALNEFGLQIAVLAFLL